MILKCFLLDCFLFVTTVAAIAEPGFSGPIQNVTTPLGREAILACTVHNLSTYKVAWLRVDTQTILTIADHVISRSRRIGVTHADHTWFLHVRGVRETDRGWYMCQINTDPMNSQLGYLDVTVPPDILDAGTSGDVRARAGEAVSMTCAVSGMPTPHQLWRRERNLPITRGDGSQVSVVEGPVLSLGVVGRQHAGGYLCIATNGVPPTVSKRISLTVEFPPVVSVRSQLVGAPLGSAATLHCEAEAFPKPVVYWTRDPRDIVPQGPHHEPLRLESWYRAVLPLTIPQVSPAHYGAYRCVARNVLGGAEASVELYPIEGLDAVAEKASDSNEYENGGSSPAHYSHTVAARCCNLTLTIIIFVKYLVL